MVSNIFATSSIWAVHFSPRRDDPAARDPVSKTGGMTVRLCPSLRAPPPGERARALTIPQREHHAQQAGTRTQRHALVTGCHPGVPRRGPGHPGNGAVAQTGERCARIAEAAGSNPASSTCANLCQRMVSRGRVEAVPVIWLLVVRLHDRPGCLGADRLASPHSPSCRSWPAAVGSCLLHRVRGRR